MHKQRPQRRITPRCPQMSQDVNSAEFENPPLRHTAQQACGLPSKFSEVTVYQMPYHPGTQILMCPSSDIKVSMSRCLIAKVSARHFLFALCLTHRKKHVFLH